jgi:predicted TIM-barrel fold metal-dependent hydrolase
MQRIFDAHLHIIDPSFPLVPNEGYLPPSFTVDAYLGEVRSLGIAAGAIVSGSFQAFDQSYLLNALDRLGPFFVGVTQLPISVSDSELHQLNARGVRAIRFNVRRGGSAGLGDLAPFAQRVHDLVGWHVELYIDSRELPRLEATLLRLPAVSIDHLGLSKEGLPIVVRLAAKGVRVKATGFGRVDFDVPTALEQIYAANSSALMFGTDLPSTRAPTPFKPSDIALVIDTLGPDAARRVLWENAVEFYKVPRQQSAPAPQPLDPTARSSQSGH